MKLIKTIPRIGSYPELQTYRCEQCQTDEINRAPAKVQSALLEVMQERQVTIGPESHAVPRPFLVMATQNPIESEGTYPLPEAQVDRFMMKVVVGYPSGEEEALVVERSLRPPPTVTPILTAETPRRTPGDDRRRLRRPADRRLRRRPDRRDPASRSGSGCRPSSRTSPSGPARAARST